MPHQNLTSSASSPGLEESLGMSIVADTVDLSVRLEHIEEGGAADQTQMLMVGDEVLTVDGRVLKEVAAEVRAMCLLHILLRWL